MSVIIFFLSLIVIITILFTQFFTIFIIQPIGAVPEGKTLIVLQLNKTKFIDSADGMCLREFGYVNLLCRGMMLSAVLKKSKILVKLPYSEYLYKLTLENKKRTF